MSDPTDYKSTLNLPRTEFPMKADLARREPLQLEAWAKSGLEARIRAQAAGRPRFVIPAGGKTNQAPRACDDEEAAEDQRVYVSCLRRMIRS